MKKAFLLIAFCFLDEQKPGLYLWSAPLYLVQSLPSLVTFPWFCASSLLRAFCKYCGWSSTGVLLGPVKVKVAQSCWTLCEPVDYTVLGILQARILEWVAIAFSRGSSWPRNRTGVSCITGRFFTIWAIRVVPNTRMKAKKSTSSLLRFLRRPRNSVALPHVGHEQLRHKQNIRRCRTLILALKGQNWGCGFLRTALPNTGLIVGSSETPCFLQNPVLSSSHLIVTSASLIWLPFSLHFLP